MRTTFRHRGIAGTAVVAAVTLSAACATGPGRGTSGTQPSRPPGSGTSSVGRAALPALRLWAGFPVNASPRPLVLTGQTINDPSTGFGSGDGRLAYLSGSFELATALPLGNRNSDGRQLITSSEALGALRSIGRGTRPGSTRLTITDVHLGTSTFSTDRGPRSLPAWNFTFAGVAHPASVLAVPAASRWPHPGMPTENGAQLGVTIPVGGHQATISFVGAHPGSGPCDAEYAVDVAQSATAASMSVRRLPNPKSSPTTVCDAVGYTRTLTVTLTPALGYRALVDSNGAAIPAT